MQHSTKLLLSAGFKGQCKTRFLRGRSSPELHFSLNGENNWEGKEKAQTEGRFAGSLLGDGETKLFGEEG